MDKDEYFQKLSKATEEPEPAASQDPEDIESEGGLKNIHTFKSDIADAIKKDGISYTKIATAEAERQKRMEGLVVPPQKKVKNFFAIVISLFLLVVGVGAVSAAFIFFRKSPSEQVAAPIQDNSFSSEYQSSVSLTQADKQSVSAAINAERKKPFAQGELKFVSIIFPGSTSTKKTDIQSLLTIYATNLAGETARSFQNNYTFGFYSGKNSNDTFLLLHTDSYDNAYGGMLAWEKYMNQDLGGFMIFPRTTTSTTTVPLINAAASTSATTTRATSTQASSTQATSSATTTVIVSTKSIPINFQFQDEVVGNKDVRVLKDSEGATIFLYSFLDQQTLVLTTSEAALQEIQSRIISSQRIQ